MLNDKSGNNRNEFKVDSSSPLNRLSNERRHTLWRPYEMQEISPKNTHDRNRKSILGKLAREINERSIFSYLLDFHRRLDHILTQGKKQYDEYRQKLDEGQTQTPEYIRDLLEKAKESICHNHANAIQRLIREIKSNAEIINKLKGSMPETEKALKKLYSYKNALTDLGDRIETNKEDRYTSFAYDKKWYRKTLIDFPGCGRKGLPGYYQMRDLQYYIKDAQKDIKGKLRM